MYLETFFLCFSISMSRKFCIGTWKLRIFSWQQIYTRSWEILELQSTVVVFLPFSIAVFALTTHEKYKDYSGCSVRKRTFWHVRSKKTQISLHIRAVWSESSLSEWRNFAFLAIQNVPSEDSDQTARMRRLIWIFAWYTCLKICFLMLQLISSFVLPL